MNVKFGSNVKNQVSDSKNKVVSKIFKIQQSKTPLQIFFSEQFGNKFCARHIYSVPDLFSHKQIQIFEYWTPNNRYWNMNMYYSCLNILVYSNFACINIIDGRSIFWTLKIVDCRLEASFNCRFRHILGIDCRFEHFYEASQRKMCRCRF